VRRGRRERRDEQRLSGDDRGDEPCDRQQEHLGSLDHRCAKYHVLGGARQYCRHDLGHRAGRDER
jgi:hypothetical protein